MKLKTGVCVHGISTELLMGLTIAATVYDNNGQELVVTSLNDSTHGKTSLHYSGNAADLRTHYFSKDVARKVRSEIDSRLGPDYDVILESNHIHLEYQPKRRD